MAPGAYCTTHHDEPSTGRCFMCHKPFCPQCRVASGQGEFCSLTCRGRYEDWKARDAELAPIRRPWLGRAVVSAVAVGALAWVAYAYFIRKDPSVRGAVREAGAEASRTGRSVEKALDRAAERLRPAEPPKKK